MIDEEMRGIEQETAHENREAMPLSWKFWKKRRYIVVLLAFLGYLSSYSLRVNLSVAIVAMAANNGTDNNVIPENNTILGVQRKMAEFFVLGSNF